MAHISHQDVCWGKGGGGAISYARFELFLICDGIRAPYKYSYYYYYYYYYVSYDCKGGLMRSRQAVSNRHGHP